MLNPQQKHFFLTNEDYSDTKTFNLEQLLLEQSNNNVGEMFVLLVTNLFERKLLTKDDLADMMGISHSQLEEAPW
ncbi:TPA: hypothetical protein MCM29_005153 [Klebsiella pneumoniae]|nr:hypothetical protein EPNKCIFM_00141 [Klebsiella phage KP13-16]HBT0444751.1 hypothetical protein [Klebsiella pneumoniae]HBT8980413.1 hypothetical protein [Klebsiella pneumoniae]